MADAAHQHGLRLIQNTVEHLRDCIFRMEGSRQYPGVAALRQHNTGGIENTHIFDLA